MNKDQWVWMPHAAHFICGNDCRFHLATYVGDYIVSTVGEYLPDSEVREIIASVKKIKLEGRGDIRLADFMKKCGYQDLGVDRKYETMVFKGRKQDKHKCCPYRIEDYTEIDCNGYNKAEDAYKGHLELCEKWGLNPPKEPA